MAQAEKTTSKAFSSQWEASFKESGTKSLSYLPIAIQECCCRFCRPLPLRPTLDAHVFIKSLFQVVSIGTTTGSASAEFSAWPSLLPVMLLFISFVGGCAGSTGGGMKVIRVLLLFKQGLRELTP